MLARGLDQQVAGLLRAPARRASTRNFASCGRLRYRNSSIRLASKSSATSNDGSRSEDFASAREEHPTQHTHEEDRVSAEEAGMSRAGSSSSSRPSRPAIGASQSFEETFADLLRIPKPHTGSSEPAARVPEVPVRQRKGVHSRQRRGEGQTPAEAMTFNTILSEIFHDLERSGPLRPGSSPTSSLFTLKPNSAASNFQPKIWGGDRAAMRRQGLMERHKKEMDGPFLDELDRLKEDMSHIDSDAALLVWARHNVFNPTVDAYGDPQFPRTYAPALAHLLRTVRTALNRPHLALAVFHYAQAHSPESYLTGCLAPAYNEILHVRWDSLRDLAGVDQGVQEMDVNGVRWDVGTRQIVSRVVSDVLAAPQAYGLGAVDIVQRLERRVEQDVDEQKDVYHLLRGATRTKPSSDYRVDM